MRDGVKEIEREREIGKEKLNIIPLSHLFGISRNQAEPAGMKNFIRATFGREFQPLVTLEAEWRWIGNSLYIPGYTIQRCSELRPDSFEGHSGRSDCIRAAFERQSKDSDGIQIAFQLNVLKYRNRFRQQSRCIRGAFRLIRGAFGTFWQDLKWLVISILPRCNQNVSNAVGMPYNSP